MYSRETLINTSIGLLLWWNHPQKLTILLNMIYDSDPGRHPGCITSHTNTCGCWGTRMRIGPRARGRCRFAVDPCQATLQYLCGRNHADAPELPQLCITMSMRFKNSEPRWHKTPVEWHERVGWWSREIIRRYPRWKGDKKERAECSAERNAIVLSTIAQLIFAPSRRPIERD